MELTWSEIGLCIVGPWSIWVTTRIFKLESDVRSNNEKDEVVSNVINKIDIKLQNIADKLDHLELTLAQEGIKIKS